MDPFANWLNGYKVPLGKWGEAFFNFIIDHFPLFFDAVSSALTWLIDGIVALLLWLPSPMVLLLLSVCFYLQRSWRLAIGVAFGLLLIANQGLWVATIQTLALVISATVASMVVGLPIGVFLGHRHRLYQVVLPVLDLMQTLPTFVYLIPTLVLFGLGTAPGLVARSFSPFPPLFAPHISALLPYRSRCVMRDGFGHPVGTALEDRGPERASDYHGGVDSVYHAFAFDGRGGCPGWSRRTWCAGCASVGIGRHSDGSGSRTFNSHSCDCARPFPQGSTNLAKSFGGNRGWSQIPCSITRSQILEVYDRNTDNRSHQVKRFWHAGAGGSLRRLSST